MILVQVPSQTRSVVTDSLIDNSLMSKAKPVGYIQDNYLHPVKWF